MKKLLALAALALVAACGKDSTAPPPITVAGAWSGVTGSQTLSLFLTENAGVVGGSGTITNTPTGTRALTVSGSYTSGPIGRVDVTLSSGSTQPFALSGQVYATSILGNLTGSGFTGEVIVFARK